MKLYMSPGACSLASHIVLEEIGRPYETEKVHLHGDKRTDSGDDYLQINPKGYVPALLLDNGEMLTEGPVIMQYLADQAPASGLAPAPGSFERYHLQAWLTFVGTELHKSFSPFFNPAAGDDWKKASMSRIEQRLAYLNDQLAERPFLMGETFTVADAYLGVILFWARHIKMELSRWPAVAAYFQRVVVRPSVQAALKAEGLAG